MINLNALTGIGLALLLIGFFSGLEIAFFSASRLNIELRKKQGKKSGQVLSFFADHPEKFIGTTLVIINLLIIVYGLLMAAFLNPFWQKMNFTNEYMVLVADVLVAAVLLLFVVFLFKAAFRAANDKIINNSFVIFSIQTTHGFFSAVASFFTSASEWMLTLVFNQRIQKDKNALTRVDLEQFIQQSKEHEEDDPTFDTELFENALQLSETRIRSCYIPRKEIEAVEANTPLETVKQKFIETKLSKLVVYDQNIDSITGYIHQLDLFKNPANIQAILLPIPAVPESMSASDLINKFTKERKSIAWVVDEFGGTAGIVTMEDLLEELFGEIHDEYDTEEFIDEQLARDEYMFSGRLELDYLKEKYQLEFPDDDSETLSGYIITRHEAIPRQRERIVIDNYEFEVLNVSATRIETVKLKVLR
jgi:putative hemolysin